MQIQTGSLCWKHQTQSASSAWSTDTPFETFSSITALFHYWISNALELPPRMAYHWEIAQSQHASYAWEWAKGLKERQSNWQRGKIPQRWYQFTWSSGTISWGFSSTSHQCLAWSRSDETAATARPNWMVHSCLPLAKFGFQRRFINLPKNPYSTGPTTGRLDEGTSWYLDKWVSGYTWTTWISQTGSLLYLLHNGRWCTTKKGASSQVAGPARLWAVCDPEDVWSYCAALQHYERNGAQVQPSPWLAHSKNSCKHCHWGAFQDCVGAHDIRYPTSWITISQFSVSCTICGWLATRIWTAWHIFIKEKKGTAPEMELLWLGEDHDLQSALKVAEKAKNGYGLAQKGPSNALRFAVRFRKLEDLLQYAKDVGLEESAPAWTVQIVRGQRWHWGARYPSIPCGTKVDGRRGAVRGRTPCCISSRWHRFLRTNELHLSGSITTVAIHSAECPSQAHDQITSYNKCRTSKRFDIVRARTCSEQEAILRRFEYPTCTAPTGSSFACKEAW